MNLAASLEQFRFLGHEIALIVNRRWWRWLSVWFSPGFAAVAGYRIDRAGYLAFGATWMALRILLLPFFMLLRLLGANCEIHYRAEIGSGLRVLHPTLGVVINGGVIVGRGLLLTGGNCIGIRSRVAAANFTIGDNVTLGANAVILGPVRVGSLAKWVLGAVVVSDAAEGSVLMGVPARPHP